MRMYESKGYKVKVEVEFDFNIRKALEVDMLERKTRGTKDAKKKLDKNKLSFSINPFEIKTYRIMK